MSAGVLKERKSGLARLAGWCYLHRRSMLATWLLLLVALIGAASSLGSSFSNSYASSSLPAQQAQNLLTSRFPAQSGATVDVVLRSTAPLAGAQVAPSVNRLVAALRPLPDVTAVTSPLAPGASHQLSANGRIGFAVVTFDKTSGDLPDSSAKNVINTAARFAGPGFSVAVGGQPANNVVTAAPGGSEGIGILAAIIIMLLAFGSVVAMGLPLLIALTGIGMGFGIVFAASHVLTVPTYGPDLMVMIGLGVGIDYALLIVTRYRQELANGREPRDATEVALSTAGRSVLFAGGTVVIALLGLLVVNLPFMDGLAVGTILAVLLVLAAAVTLLPAMLGFCGHAIDKLRLPGLKVRQGGEDGKQAGGFWVRWSRTVQRHPVVGGIAAVAVLVIIGLPLFSMRQAFSDAGNNPTSLTTRQAYDMLSDGFGPGFNGPLVVVATLPGRAAAGTVSTLADRVRGTADVASVDPPELNQAGDAAVLIVYPQTSPQAAATASLVTELREHVIPQATAGTGVAAYVGGESATGLDTAAYMAARLPWVIAVVVGLGFLLLVFAFRSVLIPLTAAIMNVLSIGAGYGAIVAVYQWGWLSGLFGVSRTGPIDPWIPLMMFAIVFGLSMDYEVFLVTRIQERWLAGRDNSAAVTEGLSSTARVITAAAAIMVCVFASFVVNDPLRILNVFGLGLAFAVFVDATLVRMVLVPSIMQLLGTANWWAPGFLRRSQESGQMAQVATPAP
jgi:RND superfamily putative drug exporter